MYWSRLYRDKWKVSGGVKIYRKTYPRCSHLHASLVQNLQNDSLVQGYHQPRLRMMTQHPILLGGPHSAFAERLLSNIVTGG